MAAAAALVCAAMAWRAAALAAPRVRAPVPRGGCARMAKPADARPLATWVRGKPKAVFAGVGPRPPTASEAPAAASGLPGAAPYLVLGIETSCDDTAAAVVRSDGVVLGEASVSQHAVHAAYGGVVPGLARDAHAAAIDRVVAEALGAAGLASAADVDAVAATAGPGLEICLCVGARAASRLAVAHGKPFVRCHHLESHCLAARLTPPDARPAYPFLALVVSGGHCQLLWVAGVGDLAVLGGTLDDALGEAYDKAARMLGLAAPTGGGPAVERAAARGNATAVALPVPMRAKKNCDFSYAGLKNALRVKIADARAARGLGDDAEPLPDADVADLAASFQRVAIAHLEDRLRLAFAAAPRSPAPTLALVGGVAANAEVRARVAAVCDEAGWALAVPPPRLCTDNGAMVAWNAVERLDLGISDDRADDEVIARWPFREFADAAPGCGEAS